MDTAFNSHNLADLLFPDTEDGTQALEARFPPRALPSGAMVTRFAPSPTGFLHLGNLYGALADERLAHRSGGVFYLRVEDTDEKREVPGALEKILEMCGEFGLALDEGATADGDAGVYGPFRQRRRAEIYHICAKELVRKGLAYPCFCTEEALDEIREKQASVKANPGYYGAWAVHRDMPPGAAAELVRAGKPYVLRLRSPGDPARRVKFTDLVKGDTEFPENDQDVVLLKSDGIPTYHFAHVVDDHFMRTTHVVRGDEWLATLPIHVQLFSLMGWPMPEYLHTAPIMKMEGASKRKLSKRKDPELALDFYRAKGFCPAALKEYILTLQNSNFEEWRDQNPAAPLSDFPFSFKKMNPAGALFDMDKLMDVAKTVMSRQSAEEVYGGLLAWAEAYEPEFALMLRRDEGYARGILSIGRGGPKPRKDFGTYSEAKEYMAFFYDGLFEIIGAYPENMGAELLKTVFGRFAETYDPRDDNSVWFEKVKAVAAGIGFAVNMKDYKKNPDAHPGSVGDVAMALRIAVTGRAQSPDLCEVMRLLGEVRVRERLNTAQGVTHE
ncbi:MAG: glutamate--tRNA ligase [Oscillospiraceae bacterium]|nr:glutamate--tRNA ligase [Oscillospiraceae bacterium]